jgi:hypothetical protein
MGHHDLNRRAFEHAKVMVKDGMYVDKPWTFTAEDSNALLGEKGKENWSEYSQWFFGLDTSEDHHTKAHYAYPYGKDGKLNLAALRAIISRAASNHDGAIEDAARECLEAAQAKDKDRATASGKCDLYLCSGQPVEIKASAPVEVNGPPLHRFNMIAYTGVPMMLSGARKDIDYTKPIIVDLAGMEGIDRNRPALKDHDPTKVVGHTESINATGGILTASGVVSNPFTQHSMEVVESSKNKFPWQASIGANIMDAEWLPAGEKVEVNGRIVSGPLTIARKSVLGEISFVALGADDATSAVIAAKSGGKGTDMKVKFKAWAKAAGFSDDDLQGEKLKAARACYQASGSYDAEDEDGKDKEDGKKEKKDGKKETAAAPALDIAASATNGVNEIRAESNRINAINTAFAQHIVVYAKDEKTTKSLIEARENAISTGVKAVDAAKDAELIALRASRGPVVGNDAAGHAFNIQAGGTGLTRDAQAADIIAASVCLSAGVPEKIALTDRNRKPLPEQAGNIAASREFRGMGLQGLVSWVAANVHGLRLRSGPLQDSDVKKVFALEARREMDISAGMDISADGFSTVTLLGITENMLNKMMLQQYDEQPSQVENICWQRDTNDFKPFKSYRMTGSGRMQLVNEAGEIKSMGVQDESYQNQLKTWGALITITRQLILNDDMGALTDQPKILGREAALTREEQVFILLYQLIAGTVQYNTAPPGATAVNVNFFSTTLKNYLSGTGSSLLTGPISAITAAIKAFMEQTDANGRPINIVPDRILAAPALREAIMTTNKGQTIVMAPLGGTGTAQKFPNPNIYAGQVSPCISAYMATALNASGNNTEWLLLGNPSSGFAPLQIGYLRGNRTPIIERGEAPFTTLGMHMRCYYDFGIAPHDFRSAVYNKGQA